VVRSVTASAQGSSASSPHESRRFGPFGAWIAAILLCSGSNGFAAPAPPPASPPDAPDPEEGIPRDAAEDLRAGHWLFAVGGAVLAPSDHLGGGTGELGAPSIGGALRADIGVGLSRYVVFELSGGASWLAEGSLCAECSSTSYDAGLGFRYHVAQGISFDPWIGLGAGYRYGATSSDAVDESASGIDVARLRFGGDYYPLPWLGLGPFFETDIGVLVEPEPLAYAAFFAGLRLVLDPMRADASLAPTIAQR
jgi:hypothetical protein